MSTTHNRRASTLFVAAGGGGDALAALLLARRLADDGTTPTIVSYAWDRRILDPMPGPRAATDFTGTRKLTPSNVEITSASRLRSGGLSTLQLLAETTSARFVLLEPHQGARGMREQLSELADYFSPESVVLVDVGGDLISAGTEETVTSPLADALALGSLANVPVPPQVAITGPGLDGELPPAYVRSRCLDLGGKLFARLDPSDVEPHFAALAQHPSESTSLLAASALGVSGQAEIRDSDAVVSVSAACADVYLLDGAAALAGNRLAQELAVTRSLVEAERVTVATCGRSELSHERQKAATLASWTTPSIDDMRRRLERYWSSSTARGITLATFRRLTEVMKLARYDARLVRSLAGSHAHPRLALSWTSLSGS